MLVKFNYDTSLIVIDHYDTENDESLEVNENFLNGEEMEWDILEDHDKTVDVQFADGAACFGIPRDLFDVLEKSE